MGEAIVQSEISGRKVFFVYPTASVKNQILTELAQHEYEVYTAKDHTRLLHALKKYPDSVLFINIDEGMGEQEWERTISGLSATMPDIKIGVFSSSSNEELQNKYINNRHLACGFMTLKLDMSKVAGKILDILNGLNVKGRRKYLRASTERETTATINIPFGGDFIKGTIKDISVVGFSCSFEQDISLSKNALVKDIQLRLQSMLLKVEAVVFGSRSNESEKIFVMLFTQRIDPDVRVKIRVYIQNNLQAKMDSEIN
ncbi:MAG: pilus assembly protein PilZ [Treponema sp.]|jgi:hypothetical protein|nr:pilus assembly protein PilZ [Treponema sp.]